MYQGQPMLAFPDPAAWEKMAGGRACRLLRAVVEAREERLFRDHRQLCRGSRRRLVLRLDRRPKAAAGRRLLAAAIHAAQAGQQVVEDQPRQGGSPDRGLLMRPAGLREVEAAKADGRWAAAYDGQSTATPRRPAPGSGRSMRTPPPSSPRSTAGTGMPSCTGSTRPRSRRPGRPASPSSWRCCAITRPRIPFRPATAQVPPRTDHCGRLRIAADLATSRQDPVAHLADKARPHHPAHQVPLQY